MSRTMFQKDGSMIISSEGLPEEQVKLLRSDRPTQLRGRMVLCSAVGVGDSMDIRITPLGGPRIEFEDG